MVKMKRPFKLLVVQYLYLSGFIAHLLIFALFVNQPHLFNKITAKLHDTYYAWQKQHDFTVLTKGKTLTISDEIELVFAAWQPQKALKTIANKFEVDGVDTDRSINLYHKLAFSF